MDFLILLVVVTCWVHYFYKPGQYRLESPHLIYCLKYYYKVLVFLHEHNLGSLAVSNWTSFSFLSRFRVLVYFSVGSWYTYLGISMNLLCYLPALWTAFFKPNLKVKIQMLCFLSLSYSGYMLAARFFPRSLYWCFELHRRTLSIDHDSVPD